jgi:hypothetical protein
MIKRSLILLTLIIGLTLTAQAQTAGTQVGRVSLTQGASVSQQGYIAGGSIILGQLVTINSSGQVIAATTSTTDGVIGVAKNSGTTSQPVDVALIGQVAALSDGTCSQGQLLQISIISAGRVNCTPSIINQQIGISDSSVAGPGNITAVLTGGGSSGSSGGANTTLSNLGTTALNADLMCATAGSCNLGSAADPVNGVYLKFFQLNTPGALILGYPGPCAAPGPSQIGSCFGDSNGAIDDWDGYSATFRPHALALVPGTFAALSAEYPCPGSEGQGGSVTDSTTNTWGATVVGGGADHVLAYCDGSAWTVAAK